MKPLPISPLIDGDADEGESTHLYGKSVSWKDGGHQLLQWIKGLEQEVTVLIAHSAAEEEKVKRELTKLDLIADYNWIFSTRQQMVCDLLKTDTGDVLWLQQRYGMRTVEASQE